MSEKIPPVIVNWAARAFGAALVAVCLWVSGRYIAKVDAMEVEVERAKFDRQLLEEVRQDVRWIKEHMGGTK